MFPGNNKKTADREKQQQHDQQQSAKNPPPTAGTDENVFAAHEQAEEDIERDPDLSLHSPTDDLDEGEIARLGDDQNDLI